MFWRRFSGKSDQRPAIQEVSTESKRSSQTSTQQDAEHGSVHELRAPDLPVDPVDPLALVGSEDSKGKVHYKTLKWWQCGFLMIAECISLGILSLPRVMAELGFVPGIILIIVLGVIAGYTGFIIGQFKLRHPECTSMADAGFILFGKWGREIFGAGQLLALMFIMAAHVTSFSIMMNVLTGHPICTIWWQVIAVLISMACTMPRTLKNISWMSIGSCISIFTAVFIVMIGVGVVKPNPDHMEMVHKTKYIGGMNAALNIVLAYSGHITYFSFASELRNPKDFTKSLLMLQTSAIAAYCTCAVVIYYYSGPGVPAPALSAASPKVRIAAFAAAAPTIVIGGVVNGSVLSKGLYLRFWQWRGRPEVIHEKSASAYITYNLINFVSWVAAWIVAESIPRFEYVLALVAALLSGWYSFGITSFLFLNMYRGALFKTPLRTFLTLLNIFIILLGAFISFFGVYTCSTAISKGEAGKPFSCDNNDPLVNIKHKLQGKE